MKRRIASVLLALTFAACSDAPTASVASDVVRVTPGDAGLRIENLTDTPRAYAAHDPEFLALADLSLLALCNTPDANCLRLPAHTSVLVPYNEVTGYGTSTKSIVVYTWRVVPSGTPGQYEQLMDEAITLKL